MMNIQYTKLQLLWRALLALLFIFITSYFVSSCSLVSTPSENSISDTSWVSLPPVAQRVSFIDEDDGIMQTLESVTPFKYQSKNGYIICRVDEEIIFDMIRIDQGRIFALNVNIMYYIEVGENA